jgi:hypothetical protein
VVVLDAAGRRVVELDGSSATVRVGAQGHAGGVLGTDANGVQTAFLDAANAVLYLGGGGQRGRPADP